MQQKVQTKSRFNKSSNYPQRQFRKQKKLIYFEMHYRKQQQNIYVSCIFILAPGKKEKDKAQKPKPL